MYIYMHYLKYFQIFARCRPSTANGLQCLLKVGGGKESTHPGTSENIQLDQSDWRKHASPTIQGQYSTE